MSTAIEPRRIAAPPTMHEVGARLLAGIPENALADLEAGREAALAGTVDHSVVSDPDEASEETRREQAKVRRRALEKFLTAKRAGCMVGLGCLDPADQHPLELQAWLNDPHASTLLLVGGTGTGKSQAAAATAAHAARYGAMMWDERRQVPVGRPLIVRGGPVNEYLRQLRPEGSPDPVWQIRDDARRAELWVGDDLGAELDGEASRFAREEIADLLDWRLEANLRQVYTSNLAAEDLERKLGDRMWSRLQEETTLITFTGRDRRVRKKLSW